MESSPENAAEAPLALVTGAGVRVGRAIAMTLSEAGFALGLHYNRSRKPAEELAKQIQLRGRQAFLLPADLTDPQQIAGLFDQVAGIPLPLKVLVNSAAIMEPIRLSSLNVEEWDATLNLNLRAPWLCARAAAGLMQNGGAIINITDAGAGRAWTGYPAYIISKAGLEALTRLLARELAPAVRVNAVAPGLILPAPNLPPETWNRLVGRLPLKRPGLPEEIAQTVLFLIQHAYITGQTIVVDGGYQLQ